MKVEIFWATSKNLLPSILYFELGQSVYWTSKIARSADNVKSY